MATLPCMASVPNLGTHVGVNYRTMIFIVNPFKHPSTESKGVYKFLRICTITTEKVMLMDTPLEKITTPSVVLAHIY